MKKLFNILLVTLLIIIELLSISLITLKITIKKDNINKIIKNTTKDINKDEKIINDITDKINRETNIDKEVIKSTLNSKTAQNVLSEITNDVIDYKMGKSEKMTNEELYNYANNNIDKVIDETDYNINYIS